MTTAIIDGDLVAFRCAASAEGDEEWVALARVDNFIASILQLTEAEEYEVWLSGKDNFRKKIYPEYKANRKEERPQHEQACKAYLKIQHNAQTLEGAEADDALGFRMYELGEEGICVTNDKDLKQIPGKHFDPVKQLSFSITPKEGLRFFYYQCLIGDPVDNIKGVPGIGPVKANKILQQAEVDFKQDGGWDGRTIKDYYQDAVLLEYSCPEEFLMNAQCVYIWQKRDDKYELPTN